MQKKKEPEICRADSKEQTIDYYHVSAHALAYQELLRLPSRIDIQRKETKSTFKNTILGSRDAKIVQLKRDGHDVHFLVTKDGEMMCLRSRSDYIFVGYNRYLDAFTFVSKRPRKIIGRRGVPIYTVDVYSIQSGLFDYCMTNREIVMPPKVIGQDGHCMYLMNNDFQNRVEGGGMGEEFAPCFVVYEVNLLSGKSVDLKLMIKFNQRIVGIGNGHIFYTMGDAILCSWCISSQSNTKVHNIQAMNIGIKTVECFDGFTLIRGTEKSRNSAETNLGTRIKGVMIAMDSIGKEMLGKVDYLPLDQSGSLKSFRVDINNFKLLGEIIVDSGVDQPPTHQTDVCVRFWTVIGTEIKFSQLKLGDYGELFDAENLSFSSTSADHIACLFQRNGVNWRYKIIIK